MNFSRSLIIGACVSSLAGFLFGFDTAVISGVEQSLKAYFELGGVAHGFTNSIALIGTMIGALLASFPADKLGRKKSLNLVGILFALSAIGCALSYHWYPFLFYRFIGGIGVGAASVIAPMYISEISPAEHRGKLVGLFQLSVVLGIFMAFATNYFIKRLAIEEAWRWMLGVEAFPALVFFTMTFFIVKSPRWLVMKEREVEVIKVLRALSYSNPEETLKTIVDSLVNGRKSTGLFQKKYYRPIMLVFLLAMFNQFSGINAIMYYAPRIFEMSGIAENSAFFQAATVGFVNMLFTIIAMTLIDKIGRKKLMFWGTLGMIASLITAALFLHSSGINSKLLVVPILTFIASFAFSQGAVIWVFISEIFPNNIRAKGQSFGTFIHWFWASVITWLFPVIAEIHNGGSFAFIFFGLAMVAQLVFVLTIFPETKGKTLEQLT